MDKNEMIKFHAAAAVANDLFMYNVYLTPAEVLAIVDADTDATVKDLFSEKLASCG